MKHTLHAIIILWTCFSMAYADVIPGRWEKVERLLPGAEIVVSTKDGQRLEATFQELTGDALKITYLGQDRELARTSISRISTLRRVDDPIKNGALIGILAGFGAGAAIGFAAGEDGVFDDFTAGENALFLGGMGAGVGSIAGAVVDKVHKKREVLYRSAG